MKQQDYNKWFGHRLKEILAERNMTVNALSAQTGFSRATITRVLKGNYASPDFVNKVADLLNIKPDRLKQADVEYPPLSRSHTREILDPAREIQTAKSHVENALGDTERGLALQALGSVYFHLKDYPTALVTYRQAHSFLSRNDDPEYVLHSYESLLQGEMACQDFHAFDVTFAEAVDRFETDPHRYLSLLDVKVALLEKQKKEADAQAVYRLIIEISQNLQDFEEEQTLTRLADCYAKLRDYPNAFHYWAHWYEAHFQQASLPRSLRQYKNLLDYCKSAYAIGHYEKALETLDKSLADVLNLNHAPLCHEYLLFLHLMKKSKRLDERLLSGAVDEDTRLIAALIHYLFSHEESATKRLISELSDQKILEYV